MKTLLKKRLWWWQCDSLSCSSAPVEPPIDSGDTAVSPVDEDGDGAEAGSIAMT